MDTVDRNLWIFYGLGLVSIMLLLGAAMLWWQTRAWQRGPLRWSSPIDRPVVAGLHSAGSAKRPWWFAPSERIEAWLRPWPGMARYERLLRQTGWPLRTGSVLMGTGILALSVIVIGASLGSPLMLSALMALATVFTVHATLLWRRQQRTTQLERQLPEALSLIARSMQAGHAFSSALQIASQESPSPIGQDLRSVFNEIQYGESTHEALGHWAERVAGEDVRVFVTAVRIQSETGGNLAELLHQTAALIRERQKLRGVVRVLSAEGRISALILTLLPFVLAGLLTTLNPEFMAPLWSDPLGLRMLTLTVALMGMGVFWMWRLVRMEI